MVYGFDSCATPLACETIRPYRTTSAPLTRSAPTVPRAGSHVHGGGDGMPGKKRAHYRGDYHVNARVVRAAANANPSAICWRCGLTLAQHEPHKNGTRPKWTAGHTIDSVPTSRLWLEVTRRPPPGAWLAPEASTCNSISGGIMRHPIYSSGYDW